MSFQEIPTQSRFHTSEGNCCSFSLQSVEAAASWETRSAYQPSLLWEDLSLCRYQTEILCGKAGLHFCHIVCPVWEGKIRLGLSPLMSQPMDKQFILAHLHASCWKFEKWPGNLSLQAAWLPRLSWWGADPVEREVVFQSTAHAGRGVDLTPRSMLISAVGKLETGPTYCPCISVHEWSSSVLWWYGYMLYQSKYCAWILLSFSFFVSLPLLIFHKINISLFTGEDEMSKKEGEFFLESNLQPLNEALGYWKKRLYFHILLWQN